MLNRKIKDKVFVITGASSGLGRAVAIELARQGARLGLIARDEQGLSSLAELCRSLGCRVSPIQCDVTEAEELTHAAREIAAELGGIDCWINNAAIAVYGEVEQVPIEEMRRVMEVNFFGQVNGIRAAAPFLEESAGPATIIGILSVLSEVAVPLQSVYVASKHALAGLYRSYQEELFHRRSSIRVGTLLVPSLATPLFDHAKTYLGFLPKPIGPIEPPERYALKVVHAALHPELHSARGVFAKVGVSSFRAFPRATTRWLAVTGYRGQRSRVPKGVADGDNLFYPMSSNFSVRGTTQSSFLWRWRGFAIGRRSALLPWAFGAFVAFGVGRVLRGRPEFSARRQIEEKAA